LKHFPNPVVFIVQKNYVTKPFVEF